MFGRNRDWQPGEWGTSTGRPRVLLEDPDGALLDVGARYLASEGFEVAVCAGPEGMGRRRCPLVAGGECELVAGADVVYTSLRWSDPDSREVLRSVRSAHPDRTVLVEITGPAQAQVADALHGCRLVAVPADRQAMVSAIRAGLATPREGEAPASS